MPSLLARSRISPWIGVSMPAMMRSSVVLPQPEGPEQGDQLAGRDVEVDVVERLEIAERLLMLRIAMLINVFSGRGVSMSCNWRMSAIRPASSAQRDDRQQGQQEATAKAAA
jgi:hypothetical protein